MFLSILYPSTCNSSINTYIVCDLNFIFMKNDVIRITNAPIYRKTRICGKAMCVLYRESWGSAETFCNRCIDHCKDASVCTCQKLLTLLYEQYIFLSLTEPFSRQENPDCVRLDHGGLDHKRKGLY